MKAINVILDLIEKGQFKDVKVCLPNADDRILCGSFNLLSNDERIGWIRSEGKPIDNWCGTKAEAITENKGTMYFWYAIEK